MSISLDPAEASLTDWEIDFFCSFVERELGNKREKRFRILRSFVEDWMEVLMVLLLFQRFLRLIIARIRSVTQTLSSNNLRIDFVR